MSLGTPQHGEMCLATGPYAGHGGPIGPSDGTVPY
jgi:hypothetical protein